MYIGQKRNPVSIILLTIVTCGIYGLWWQYNAGREINAALGREAVNPTLVILSLFCFPVLLYYMYTLDNALMELAPQRGVAYSSNFILWIILSLFTGLGTIVEMIQVQSTLNNIWDVPMAPPPQQVW